MLWLGAVDDYDDIAIRVRDVYGGGGFTPRNPKTLQFETPRVRVKSEGFYPRTSGTT